MSKYEDQLNLCWKILPAVSRSFVLCIKALPYPTDVHMMVSYLTLRIIDTIEDATAPVETKEAAFNKVVELFKLNQPPVEKVRACKELLLKEIDHTYERVLLENMGAVVDVFHSFGQVEKEAILGCTEEMTLGMMKFQTLTIADFNLQEEYCYYVAGIVGHLDTRLFQVGGHISDGLCEELMESAKHFGIALQKVNILRDIAYDIPERRFFWPHDLLKKHGLEYETLCNEQNRPQAMKVLQEVVENALPYLEAAINYVTRLPRRARKVRIFCLPHNYT